MPNNYYTKIYEIVKSAIESFANESGKENIVISNETRLIGSTSNFDSSDLVQIIVEVEEIINSEFDSNIILTDEKAMSRSTSPFINVETLVRFINESLNEK